MRAESETGGANWKNFVKYVENIPGSCGEMHKKLAFSAKFDIVGTLKDKLSPSRSPAAELKLRKKIMYQFEPVNRRNAAKLRKYYEHCDFELCEYSVGTKLMWKKMLHPSWAEIAGCLVVKNEIDGDIAFDYPVPGPEGDEDAALDAIELMCLRQGIPLHISVVPEEKALRLLVRYPYAMVGNVRTWQDYLYYPEDLQYFTGRRYSGQRNHLNKFKTTWPNAEFRPLTPQDKPAIEQFWVDYESEFSKKQNEKALHELEESKKMLNMLDRPFLLGGAVFDGEKIVALSLGEICGETLIIHIEKALYSYSGAYQMIVQSFADHYGTGCKWINREDDAADRGLRTSKMQYCPAKMAAKYSFVPQNELLRHVKEIPELTTERLTLTELREADIPAYNALVLNQERNIWWGYDDVKGLGGPVEERSFFEVARRDFENRLAVNFAIRLEGRFIGEAVLYDFDCRGGAELGCRIDPAYAGQGYGTEAFRAVAEWALYKIHLNRVVAKCFHENEASYKMLSSCMRKHGKDETFDYFEKLV